MPLIEPSICSKGMGAAQGRSKMLTTAWLLAAMIDAVTPAADARCSNRATSLVVMTAQHRLWQCEAGKTVGEYAVALGTGGVGKRRQGDAKVPLGEYTLGAPRPSANFHRFIPVGYPTTLQRRSGYTGGDVGVHGPARGFERMPSAANTSVDWTLGCIAVGSDEEIDRIATWVRDRRVRTIIIE